MKLTPQLRFNNDKCREALQFYKNALGGGEIEIMLMGDSPMGKDYPEMKNKVMHSTLKYKGLEIVASDMMRDQAKSGDQVSLMLNCDSEEEINSIFKKLAEGGEIFMPVEKQFWGALFGVLTDKYGIEWSLNFPLK